MCVVIVMVMVLESRRHCNMMLYAYVDTVYFNQLYIHSHATYTPGDGLIQKKKL